MLRFADADEVPPLETFLPDPEEVEDRIVEQLERARRCSPVSSARTPRGRCCCRVGDPGGARRSGRSVCARRTCSPSRGSIPSFPIMLETYRACLQDVFDLPGLEELLSAIRRREIRVDDVETRSASPFARSLVFAYTATYLYQGDTPVAERRAQALTLDRHMLRDLLGHEELRDLLDASGPRRDGGRAAGVGSRVPRAHMPMRSTICCAGSAISRREGDRAA